ncbi:MAG TPA: hypothetical protein VM658_01085 [bacterium]|nr:hypothetical protein [bacterium]
MTRMEKIGMVAGLGLAVLLMAACDDIWGPITDNSAPPPSPEIKRAAAPASLTREEMEAAYNFILSTRATIREMAGHTLELREKGEMSQFGDARSKFVFQAKNWKAVIDGRKGTIASTGETYPPGHPASLLKQAFGLLKQELDDYYKDINDMKRTTPPADPQLMETMKKVRAALDQLAPPEGGQPIPIK